MQFITLRTKTGLAILKEMIGLGSAVVRRWLIHIRQQVHLVDQHADLADAEHAEDVAVPLAVLAHAFACPKKVRKLFQR